MFVHRLMMFLAGVAVVAASVATSVATTVTVTEPSPARIAVPAIPPLMSTLDGEQPIRLQSLQIHGAISGGMAETTVRMVFFNPNRRALEGNLQFPLLAGQQVTAFSLDIDGQLRPAVPVEKARGRHIFEEVERRQVDPGLLEKTRGNNYQLRVYPIPAQGSRSVELKYAEALAREGARWSYRLPLTYGERVQDFDLTLQVHGGNSGGASPPLAQSVLGAITFTPTRDGYQARVAKSRFMPSGTLNLLLPASAQPQSYVQEHDGSTYFVAEIPVSGQRTPRPLPKVVGLLWDSSGSGAARAHDAELVELDRYFTALGNAEVRLTRLRDRADATQIFQVVGGHWDALRRALKSTLYDGASALNDWQPQVDVGEYLLVSDGLANYGHARLPTLAAGQRLYALNSALLADAGRLSALAQRSGGRLVQVLPDQQGAAAAALLSEGAHISNMHAIGASDLLVDVEDATSGVLRVAGRLTQPTAQLTLTLVEQGKPRQIQLKVAADAPRHAQAAQVWAGYKLQQLEAGADAHRGEIRRLGTRFGIATRETSLIVLDSLEDYVRYQVTPPAAYLAAYEKLNQQRGAALRAKRQKHLDAVVREFEQKITWWETVYPKDAPPKPVMKAASINVAEAAPAMMAMAAPVSSRPSAPAADMARRQASEQSASREQRAASATSAQATSTPNEIGISLKKWRADAPYIDRMRAASAATIYAVYLDEKPDYANSSAFFLDAADMLLDKGLRDLALRVLSNLAEMELENRQILRILGYRLLQAGEPELALAVFEQVRLLAEEEPQSWRDLGLAHAAAGHPQAAVDLLHEVVIRPWDDRFAEIELIALAEMNALIATAPKPLATSQIDARLLKNLPLDLRAVLTWDADNSDMDLWVTDPNGEKCYYGHRFTYQGGRMSRDFTGGYGPEEFSLRLAKPGKYRIEANFFGSRQQVVAGATTLQVKLSSGFGTSTAKEQLLTLRLKGRGESVFVGEFEVKGKQ
jgi:hypothetical protein